MTRVAGCVECEKGTAGSPPLVYSFDFPDLGFTAIFDVARAWRLVLARAERDGLESVGALLSAPDVLEWLSRYGDVDPAHVDHLPAEFDNTAGLGADLDIRALAPWAELPPGRPDRQTVLIDGNHRAARAARAGCDFPVLWLNDAEVRAALVAIAAGNDALRALAMQGCIPDAVAARMMRENDGAARG